MTPMMWASPARSAALAGIWPPTVHVHVVFAASSRAPAHRRRPSPRHDAPRAGMRPRVHAPARRPAVPACSPRIHPRSSRPWRDSATSRRFQTRPAVPAGHGPATDNRRTISGSPHRCARGACPARPTAPTSSGAACTHPARRSGSPPRESAARRRATTPPASRAPRHASRAVAPASTPTTDRCQPPRGRATAPATGTPQRSARCNVAASAAAAIPRAAHHHLPGSGTPS